MPQGSVCLDGAAGSRQFADGHVKITEWPHFGMRVRDGLQCFFFLNLPFNFVAHVSLWYTPNDVNPVKSQKAMCKITFAFPVVVTRSH